MSPYNSYSSVGSSRLSTYRPLPAPSSYSCVDRWRPPLSSSTFRSASSYVSAATLPSYLHTPSTYSYRTRTPVISPVTRYAALPSSVESSWKSDYSWRRSPSLSRRGSSLADASDTSLPDAAQKVPSYRTSCGSFGSSQDRAKDRNARIGLNNLGNTCFMNAVLQCLCHTQPLVDYCLKESYASDVNHRSPTRGNLIKVFADFVRLVMSGGGGGAVSPLQLRAEVQRFAPRFSGDNQHDAQEFLRYLLQGLHDDINRVKVKPARRDSAHSDLQTWRRYRETDDSLIVDVFAGQLKSTLRCGDCAGESVTFDPFWDLSLPLAQGYRSSLRECFDLFSAPEVLDGPNMASCESCRKKSRSSKKMEVHKFPKVLVIHLKRFSSTCYGQKLGQMVDCPTLLANVSHFGSHNCEGGSCGYALYGVVEHSGSNSCGHYVAKCRDPNTGQWHEFNDHRVTKTSDIVTSKAYILFYIQE